MKLQAASSNYLFKHLSPRGRKIRRKNTQTDHSNLKALQAKYAKTDVTLDDCQHNEICKIRDATDKKTTYLASQFR